MGTTLSVNPIPPIIIGAMLLAAQGAKIDAKRCNAAYDGLQDDEIPADNGDMRYSRQRADGKAWQKKGRDLKGYS
ncbi:hypothetical protein ACFFWA_41435 [Actinomadura verrucosospora]|uniref:hypothetical protein n=1 Tax=Actinomadura verrucosospora TaxID=46165 RepID=UPI0031E96DC3